MIYVFFRITAFFLSTGIIFPNGTPKLFKIYFSLLLSSMISINLGINIKIQNFYELIKNGITETINGLLLGYMVAICFYIIKMVGKLIDGQIGLTMASTYDPNTQSQSTVMENLTYFIAIVVFFSINGHHIIMNSIQNSFKIIPIGYSIIDYNFTYILNIFNQYFVMGIKMVIPLIVVLIVTDIVTGIISRSISGLNVMVIGAPLKILVGIIVLLISLPFIINGMKDMIKYLKEVIEGTLSYQFIRY